MRVCVCVCLWDTQLNTRRGRGMLMVFKMEREGGGGVHLSPSEITVAIETPNVKYKAKQRLTSILAGIKPHGSLTCCVYVWGSLSTYKEGPCSCNVTTTLAYLSPETEQKISQACLRPLIISYQWKKWMKSTQQMNRFSTECISTPAEE